MSVKLNISVPDINNQLSQGFDFIRVFRSTQGPGGPFVEITADVPKPATLTGTVVGPFNVSTLSILLRINRGPTQTATISGSNPLSAAQVAANIVGQISGVTAEDDGTGRLKISTTGSGTDEILEVLGSTDILPELGFTIGQFDIGEASRIPLVENVTEYLFEDVAGSDDDYYEIDFINSTTSGTSDRSDPVKGQTVQTAAKQQADTRSPRGLTLLRKSTHVFREAFFKDADCLDPMLPLDASKYPQFQVIDINGQIVAAGLATLDGTIGNYRVEFFVPADAPISNDDRRWRIEWLFIDENNRQLEKTTEFDVRDPEITATEVRDQKYTAMACKPFPVHVRLKKRPYSIRLDVSHAMNDADVLVDGAIYPGSGASGENLLTEILDNETAVYRYEVGENLLGAGQVYKAVWTLMESIASSPEYIFQIITVPPPQILQYFPSLRMVIDKYQKRREIVQAYQDSDIYEYLIRGLEFVNSWHPLTNWSLTTVPGPIVPYWLMAGQLWGLNAQFLLETDLQFSFSGQTVTLDYDHTSNLDTAIQRAVDFIQNGLTPAKTPLLRRAQGVGAFAGKPYRYSAIHNFTFPISSFGSQDFLTLLSNIGLL